MVYRKADGAVSGLGVISGACRLRLDAFVDLLSQFLRSAHRAGADRMAD